MIEYVTEKGLKELNKSKKINISYFNFCNKVLFGNHTPRERANKDAFKPLPLTHGFDISNEKSRIHRVV
jgi:hypothetical protein